MAVWRFDFCASADSWAAIGESSGFCVSGPGPVASDGTGLQEHHILCFGAQVCSCCHKFDWHEQPKNYLENIAYYFRQLWLVLGVKLMEINSNLFSR